jgi:hypothetical protein
VENETKNGGCFEKQNAHCQTPKAEQKTTCINRHAHQWFFGAKFGPKVGKFSEKMWFFLV